MSPWTIYWILQLDSINSMLVVVSFLLGVGAILGGIFGFIEDIPKIAKLARNMGMALCACLLGLAFLPSSKTVAAMVILPAIVNNTTIQKESGELYQMAKDALRNAALPEKTKKD